VTKETHLVEEMGNKSKMIKFQTSDLYSQNLVPTIGTYGVKWVKTLELKKLKF